VDALAAQGLHEIVGWSFTGAQPAKRLRLAEVDAVELENPMSVEGSRLRTTLLGSLLDAAARNVSHDAQRVWLFEAGAVYLPRERALPREPFHLGALLSGPVRRPTWREPAPAAADFFVAKGVLGALMGALRVPWRLRAAPQPFLHPGRCAEITVAERPVGWLGEIHPEVAAAWGLEHAVGAFELDLDEVAAHARPAPLYEDLTSFPGVREDLALVVPDDVPAARLLDVVARAGAPLLTDVEVFDVYRDPERIGAGNVSLALRLLYRAADRTLTDAEVAGQREQIIAAVASELGARIRGA
jgi:phenylalanyl-tRNA synthetase beta chain